MLTINVKDLNMTINLRKKLTSGSVGIPVEIYFNDENWAGLTKSAIFRIDPPNDPPLINSIDLLLQEGVDDEGKKIYTCEIPWELMEERNVDKDLYMGVYGIKTSLSNIVTSLDNADSSKYKRRFPTEFVFLGKILKGAYGNGESSNTPPLTPQKYDQIHDIAQNAENIAQSVRDDADAGKFDGDVFYTTFEITPDTGKLHAYTAPGYDNVTFSLNEEGELVAGISMLGKQ